MDGNLAMADQYLYETEEINNFWADVYHHMEEYQCTEKEAIDVVRKIYKF
ncbi:hypothetical protein [Rossellomorea vietnamensis]|nr:hypothetical protein [Rossellomorea vietnamensis]